MWNMQREWGPSFKFDFLRFADLLSNALVRFAHTLIVKGRMTNVHFVVKACEQFAKGKQL